jgi:beta-glucosidase
VSGPRFPRDFVWGTATSAFQIEGATDEGGRGPSIWDAFCAQPGRVLGGHDGRDACDHVHRWPADLDLVAGMNLDAYRFSIAWPRVQPTGRGRANEAGLDFYDRLVDGMVARGLAPYATLYHWDLPQALEERGGWRARDTAFAFADYAQLVADRLGDRVVSFATLNEPWCSAHLGYATGEHAPGLRDLGASLQVAHHLLFAHGLGMAALRAGAPRARHGIVLNLYPAYPASDRDEDVAAAGRQHLFQNRWYLDPLLRGRYPAEAWSGYGDLVPEVRDGDLATISAPLDLLGVNYYSRAVVADAPDRPYPRTRPVEGADDVTAMGWEIYPAGLRDLLTDLHASDRLPDVYITENGAAFDDRVDGRGAVPDPERIRYLEGHLAALAEAIEDGVPVRGYFAWSLLDNFEWAWGYARRFGLVHVDFDTQVRTPKASARWYADFVAAQRR